jgi:hypothetical protein
MERTRRNSAIFLEKLLEIPALADLSQTHTNAATPNV